MQIEMRLLPGSVETDCKHSHQQQVICNWPKLMLHIVIVAHVNLPNLTQKLTKITCFFG